MNINEVQATLQKLKNKKITQAEIARALKKDRSNINIKAKRGTELKLIEVEQLEKYFDVILTNDVLHLARIVNKINNNNVDNITTNSECTCGEQFNVPYWENLPENLKRPKITSIHTDIELIENDWQLKSEIIRVIPMKGDCLQNYWYPMRHNDILAFDITNKDLNNDGIFVFTTNEGENIYIRKLNLLMDGNINVMDYTNHEPQIVKTITPEKAKEVNFEIIGRVFKNISLRI